MTQFEQALQAAQEGTLNTPTVSTPNGNVNYFGYQLATHLFNLKLMAKGMKFANVKFKHIKDYYGLQGKSAKQCVPQMEKIYNEYKITLGL